MASDPQLAPHIQGLLRSAQHELQQLNRERVEVVKRICTIKRTLVGLAEIFGEKVLDGELRSLVLHKTQNAQPRLTTVLPRGTSKRATFPYR